MNRINNYDELVAARKTTEAVIADRKQIIRERIQDFKEKISPLFYILPILSIFKKGNSNNSLMKAGSSLIIDLLVGQKLLRTANWFARLVVPMLLKTVSSRVIERVNKD